MLDVQALDRVSTHWVGPLFGGDFEHGGWTRWHSGRSGYVSVAPEREPASRIPKFFRSSVHLQNVFVDGRV
jgi:hypothetical protein